MAGRRKQPKDVFTDLLFSWSLRQIFNHDLYKYQVKRIPDEFKDVKGYLRSFQIPLLEELHAQIASALETVEKAPFAEVTDICESETDELVYDIKVDLWRNSTRERDVAPYRTLPGDILLITDKIPKRIKDYMMKNVGRVYHFASVKSVEDDGDGNAIASSQFGVKTTVEIDVKKVKGKLFYAVHLINVTPNKRIWTALQMHQNLNVIERVLNTDDMMEESCNLCPRKSDFEESKFSSSLLSKLNPSQRAAILVTMSKVVCNHKASVELIKGPPGTGKTTTLSILLYALLRMGIRTLVCAPTNVAITELASRVVALVKNSVEDGSDECFPPCSFGDMVIFGNRDNLKIESDIEEIFLDYRVQWLHSCAGWKLHVNSMINFLDDVVCQHGVYVENELINAQRELSDDKVQSRPKSFLEFARERFARIAVPLRASMETLVKHLPSRFILKKNMEGISQLMSLLDLMEKLWFRDRRLTSDQLKSVFEPHGTNVSEELVRIRIKCMSVLTSLKESLSEVISKRISTERFCFQTAQLIFCTISTSFKLHSVKKLKPFKLLVIDEAAQVKECESVIALQIPEVKHAILVGDECQLTATVCSPLSESAGFGRSLFERLSSLGHHKYLLNMQYRMHPEISRFPNEKFYINEIRDAPSVLSESYKKHYLKGRMFGPFSFIDIREGIEKPDNVGHSKQNLFEVAVAVKLVKKLFEAWNSTTPKEKLSIGVISPYAAQVAAIKHKLHRKYANDNGFVVKVKSIDGFQGGEEDVIIISVVRSNCPKYIGFFNSPKRVNVALTRARHCLWVLGNAEALSKTDSVWKELIDDAKGCRSFFAADEDHEFGKAIVAAKKEMEKLNAWLNADNTLFQNSRWKVLYSDNFRNSFQKLKSSNLKKLAMDLLLKLENGFITNKANVVDWECPSLSQKVKKVKFKDYYIICTIELTNHSTYERVLKVWDILLKSEAPKLLKGLDNISTMFSSDYDSKMKLSKGSSEVPKSQSTSKQIWQCKKKDEPESSSGTRDCAAENSEVSKSLLLMKFYSLSTGTVNHLLSNLNGREADLPFEVTDEEHEIIKFPKSSFILGRSGTGRTAILTRKLFQKCQQNLQDAFDKTDESRETGVHQLFVTASQRLCHAVRKHVSCLRRSETENFSGDGSSADAEDIDEVAELKDIPDTFVGIEPGKYPLIITLNKFLMMLDGTLGDSYFQRFQDVRSFSQSEGQRSVSMETFIRKNEVNFDRFRYAYWPHFNSSLTKNLDPSRVFAEIMSDIKGGLQEGEDTDKRSREAYTAFSESRVSTLSAEKRNLIYDIFEDYERIKIDRNEFDLSDFVLDIHRRLIKRNLPGDKVDFVYIDEVQDLTMRQICLFKYICKNVDEGFVFSGDRAQIIARGTGFRFEDIRSLFYNEFFKKSGNFEFSERREKELIPDIVSLSQTFRTHTGVLRLAQSVTDLISYFFPQSIDVLAPETSLIYGELPIFLEPRSDENLITSIFRNGGSVGEKWIGFGADQVILVRDDFEKREISNHLGHRALILTIVECKGLEFQDVLLYNFFGSSPMGNQWKVLYEYLKENSLLDANSPKSFPNFTLSKHDILCSELKQLYMAITRTRQRLWICEKNEEISKPILEYWKSLFLVQVRKLDDSLAQAMQRMSSPEEWKAQGIELFWEKSYEMAIMCFEKAGDETWEKRAKASGLRTAAYSLRNSDPSQTHTMLREAAELFDSINRSDSAAECFCDFGEYETAGRIYLDKCGESGLRKAGDCFCLAENYITAAEVYAKGGFFNDCLYACTRGNLFDLGLQYIESWKDALCNSSIITRHLEIDLIAQEYLRKCALECHGRNDKAMMMKFVRAFNTIESKRDFLNKLDCLEEILVLEEELGNFNEAVDIAKRLGNVPREVDLLEKAGLLKNATSLALFYVLSKSQWLPKPFLNKEELLAKAVSTAQIVSETFYTSVSIEAKILLHKKGNPSELMQCYMSSKQCGTLVGEILSIQKLLDVHVKSDSALFEWEIEVGVPPNVLDERILSNRLSCATLFHIWNLWKVKSFDILECLDSFENMDVVKYEGLVQFCLDYFGIRLQSSSSREFILLFPNASWCKTVDERFMIRSRNLVILDASHFSSAARKHWLQELLAAGVAALKVLKSLYMLSKMKRVSKDIQSLCLMYIFDIAKFLMDSKTFDLEKKDPWKLQDYVTLSMDYLENAFPLNPQTSMSEATINLRDMELSKNLLGEIILSNIADLRNGLTYGQVGRAAMILMGLGMPTQDVCDLIGKRFSNTVSSWKPFFENFVGVSNSQPMSYVLYKALEETYNADWTAKDYMTPPCFFYLVERLLVLVAHSQGYFYTVKSSFVEYLLCLNSNANPRSRFESLDTKRGTDGGRIATFILNLVQECLNDTVTTEEWIKAASIDCIYYFPVLLLRLFVIMCLLCLNSNASFVTVTRLLRVPHIRSQLPQQFCAVLCSGNSNGRACVASLVSAAFQALGDPLVIVSVDVPCPYQLCPENAVLVNLRTMTTRDEVMRSLFPGSVVGSNGGEIDGDVIVDMSQENREGEVEENAGEVAECSQKNSKKKREKEGKRWRRRMLRKNMIEAINNKNKIK